MKYKVGDIVKLRDDLEVNKFYGNTKLNEAMVNVIGKKAEIKEIVKNKNKDEYYAKFASRYGGNWFISDEMIEGLWEECKSSEQVSKSESKYKLIDILNKIANGELKKGTKLVLGNNGGIEYKGTEDYFMFRGKDLTKEVELIELDHSPDVGKMAEHFRDDTKMILELRDKFLLTDDVSESMKIDMMWDKLNEVVRVINKRVLDKGE